MPKNKTLAKYPPKLAKYPKEEHYPELYNDEVDQYEVKKSKKNPKDQDLQDEEEENIEEEVAGNEEYDEEEEGGSNENNEGEGVDDDNVEEADLDKMEKDHNSQVIVMRMIIRLFFSIYN